MDKETISQQIDRLFQALGVWGIFQIVQLIIVESLCFPASNELLVVLYTGYQPPVRCKGLENITHTDNSTKIGNFTDYQQFYKICNQVVDIVNGSRVTGSCSRGYEYSQPKDTTFVAEWDLVCERSYQAQLPQTLLIGGQLTGASFFTSMADKFGRRKICLLSQLGLLVMSVASAFSPSLPAMAVMRFFTGAFQQGIVMSVSVIPLELLPTKYRGVAFLLFAGLWPISVQLLNGLGYAFQRYNWRYLQLAISGVIFLTFIPNVVCLKETLRWLFANSRFDEAKQIISKALRMNRASETEVWQQTEKCITESEKPPQTLDKAMELKDLLGKETAADGGVIEAKTPVMELSVLDVFRYPRLRFPTLVMFYVWIVNALTYFGMILTASKLAGNRFLNFFLVSIDMLPATIIAYFILIRVGRKAAVCVFHAITGVCVIVAVLIQVFAGDEFSTAVLVFTVLGKFGNSASFMLLFLYTPELYPTNLRSFGLGLASSASRLGGMLAPFANLVVDYVPWVPSTVFGVCSLVACVFVMLLPETLNKHLPQTVEEINKWQDYSVCGHKPRSSRRERHAVKS